MNDPTPPERPSTDIRQTRVEASHQSGLPAYPIGTTPPSISHSDPQTQGIATDKPTTPTSPENFRPHPATLVPPKMEYSTSTQANPQPALPYSNSGPRMVTPLDRLSTTPALVDCPVCRHTTTTTTTLNVGNQANLWAGVLCVFTGCLCAWIPWVMDSCKDTRQSCGECGTLLATVRASGRVVVQVVEGSRFG